MVLHGKEAPIAGGDMAKELARTLHLVVAVVTAATLAACGGAGGTASRGESTPPRSSSPAPETETTAQGRAAATGLPGSTPAAAGVSPQSPVPAAIAGLSFDYTSFPQSTTPEGYFVLGQPDAPVLIQYYSDFL